MILAIVSAICVAAGTTCIVRLHTLQTGLDPTRDAVSDYGTTRFHALYRAQVVLIGVGAALLALALSAKTDIGATVVWLWVFAASRVAIAFFMTDDPDASVTREGRIHWLLAAIAFTSIGFGAPNIGQALADDAGWSQLAHVLGWLVAATAVATLLSARLLRDRFGLVERALYVAYIAWLLVVATTLAT